MNYNQNRNQNPNFNQNPNPGQNFEVICYSCNTPGHTPRNCNKQINMDQQLLQPQQEQQQRQEFNQQDNSNALPGTGAQLNATNLIENKTEKVNLSTSNTILHIISLAEGLKNPIHMINTGAGSKLIKQQAVKTNVKINKFESLKLTGINEHPVFILGQIAINIFGYLTTPNIIPNEVPIEHDGILGTEFF